MLSKNHSIILQNWKWNAELNALNTIFWVNYYCMDDLTADAVCGSNCLCSTGAPKFLSCKKTMNHSISLVEGYSIHKRQRGNAPHYRPSASDLYLLLIFCSNYSLIPVFEIISESFILFHVVAFRCILIMFLNVSVVTALLQAVITISHHFSSSYCNITDYLRSFRSTITLTSCLITQGLSTTLRSISHHAPVQPPHPFWNNFKGIYA